MSVSTTAFARGPVTPRWVLLLAVTVALVGLMLTSVAGPVSQSLQRPGGLGPASPSVASPSVTAPRPMSSPIAPSGPTGTSMGSPATSGALFALHPVRGTPTHPTSAGGAVAGSSGPLSSGPGPALPPSTEGAGTATHSSATVLPGSSSGVITPTRAPAAPRMTANVPQVPVSNLTGWNGINFTSSNCSCSPPDVQIAVGPRAIEEMTNLEEAVYSKTGTLLTQMNLTTFYNVPSDSLSDPRVLYDNLSGRWFASVMDISSFVTLLAVSSGSDPSSSWSVYTLPTNMSSTSYPELPDQPYIGVSSTMVSVSANDFNWTTGAEDGTQYSVLNKTEMLLGVGAHYYVWGPFVNGGNYYPNARAVDALTPTDLAYFELVNPASYYLTIEISGVPPMVPTMSVTGSLLATAVAAPPPAPQPGTTYTLDAGNGGIQSAVWQDGIVTTALVDSCAGGATSCARITQAYSTNSTIVQDYDWEAGEPFTYAAATVDGAGNILMGLGLSGSNLYPSFATGGILHAEPGYANGWYVQYGSASWTSAFACNGANVCRYGDYFGAAKDPTSDTVWAAGEYINSTPLWSTWIESEVADPLNVRATAAPVAIDLGGSATYSAIPNGGSNSYTYVWTGLPAGCTGTTAQDISCTPTSSGTFTAYVNVTDLMGVTVMGEATLTVNALPTLGPPTASLPSGDVGLSVVFSSAAPSGGTSPFTYLWSGLPAGCGAATASSVTCTFTTAGNLSLSVDATDIYGAVATSPDFPYTVQPAPTLGAPTASVPAADVGQTTTFTSAVAAGGTPPYSYVWAGLPSGCGSSNSSSVTCTFTAAATLTLQVAAVDSIGGNATSAPLTYVVSPSLSVGTPTASPHSADTGTKFTFSVVTSGGSGGDHYAWSGLPSGCSSVDAASVTCTPNSAGDFVVSVTVTDSNGAHVTSTGVKVSVTTPPGLFGLSGSTGYILLGVIIVVIVAALVAALVARRRRRRGAQPFTGPPPSGTSPSPGEFGGNPPPPPTS